MENNYELYHYGVKGMKWGVRRALKRASKNDRYERKIATLNLDRDAYALKAEKAHSKYDISKGNKAKVKANKYRLKADKLESKTLKPKISSNEAKYDKLMYKADKLRYKAAKKDIEGNRIAKSTGYGIVATQYSIKSDKVARKAAKFKYRMAKNTRYINTMKRKISSLSPDDYEKGKEYLSLLINDR